MIWKKKSHFDFTFTHFCFKFCGLLKIYTMFKDVKLIYSETTKFCEISTNHLTGSTWTNNWWRFCKNLWPSQNISTLQIFFYFATLLLMCFCNYRNWWIMWDLFLNCFLDMICTLKFKEYLNLYVVFIQWHKNYLPK